MAAIAEAREAAALDWAPCGPTGPFLCLWPKALSTPRPIVAAALGHVKGRNSQNSADSIMRMPIVIAVLASLSALLPACANPEAAKASRAAAIAEADSDDDAQCRAGGAAPDSQAYDECRSRLVETRAKADSAREQRKAAFQHTTGAGTEALSGH